MTAADLIAKARALIEPLTGHTPGEWEMSVTHPTNACANVRCDYTEIATLYGGDSDTRTPAEGEPWGPQPIRDANARLTAAAPALRDTVAALADLADALAQENARLLAENERMRKMRFNCTCPDPDECGCDNDMIVTEHASEAEARAALQADEAAK